jgi:hypothetical protein
VFCGQVSKCLKDLLTELEGRLKELGTELNGVNCTFDSWQAEDYQAILQKAAVVIEFHAATTHLIVQEKKKQGKGKKQAAISERVVKVGLGVNSNKYCYGFEKSFSSCK